MRQGRLLTICLVASLGIHVAIAAHLGLSEDDQGRAASPGGDIAVIGGLEDLVMGSLASQSAEPVEEVEEPLEAEPVEEAVAEVEPVEEVTPEEAEPVEDVPISEPEQAEAQPVEAPVEEVVEPETADPIAPVAALAPILEDSETPAMTMPQDPLPEESEIVPELIEEQPLPEPEAESEPEAEPEPVREQAAEPVEVEEAEVVEPESAVADLVNAPVPDAKPAVRRAKRLQKPKRVARSRASNAGNSDRDQQRGQSVGTRTANLGDGGRKATSSYLGRIVSRLQRAQRYPRKARRAEGTVMVRFTIAPGGQVSGLRVLRSSGNRVLDEAALATVRRVSPMPAFPSEMPQKPKSVKVPFAYKAP
ncbi:energy transducer TonB [Breoghania sp.]|uniref:cell envelope integrity protein TolA n=1 Tax=Breoghania sp. TaxID=2065378 RepID=UPI002AA962CF|nr:energy transducer TonB [Breoghania sp.]